ncbi:hypothetical protein COMA2_80179 [Candidatus Nitrospira nitrificans]|uniref:Uncharacterized protein n=1 Tax=Candidatus Nitrospira nitrificans TaxID=1742973 RepID=A0A0S4LQE9_9BACT|nr:hypothetical protein COMA2_80179 [Candidatus Nitrospira nitrificans]
MSIVGCHGGIVATDILDKREYKEEDRRHYDAVVEESTATSSALDIVQRYRCRLEQR